ncbi:MAG: ATP-binding cassette domain-containing protein [Planctomycetes bacterium]|nr:ATP-binding cassette domain-containing protein [Planctomycetota bacterium]
MGTAWNPTTVLEVRDLVVERSGAAPLRWEGLALAPGEAVCLHGPSGAGKTTLLRALLGLTEQDVRRQGSVTMLGASWPPAGPDALRRALRTDVTFLPQDGRTALDPMQQLAAWLGAVGAGTPEAVGEALAALGVGGLGGRRPHEVSGGEAQRALLAVALLRRARLLVLDEPTASLDAANCARVVGVLRDACRTRGLALLCATHERGLATALGATTHVLSGGVARAAALPAPPPAAARPEPAGARVLLAAHDVHVSQRGRPVLAGAELALHEAEVVALLGPSGAGKSTLARVLAGLLVPGRGAVVRAADVRGPAVQLVCQDAGASLTPGRTLRGLLAETAVPGFAAEVEAARLGLDPACLARTRAALSAGEQRRAALLRALSVRPRVLILDEPTAGLDDAGAARTLDLLRSLRSAHGLSLLLITHDEELARAHAHRLVRLEEGRTCS